MLSHFRIASVKFHLKNGETVRYALVETKSDFVIAHGYRGETLDWEQGIYFPKAQHPTAETLLANFANDVQSFANSSWVSTVELEPLI